ncbi:MAG: HAMP domain-containing histidine kinase [Clostridia bacterium]|nr:HAMP domain-containing histidine kinase [Clostridia bacterium]
MKLVREKIRKQRYLQRTLPEEISFFSVKGYIISVVAALVLALIPPLIYEFNFNVLFTKYGIWYFAYYLIMAAIVYRFILYFVKVNYSKHLQKISESTRKVAKGDFTVHIDMDENLKDNSYINIMFRDFNTMVEELNSIESLKDDFVANVSHEIKTPLSVINNYTTALKDSNLSEETRAEYIETIIESTDKLSKLVTNILRLSKIENRKITPEQTEFDLCRQLSECILSFEDIWEKKEIELLVEMEDRVVVNENFAFLEVIWNNLLSNAFKFTDNGGTVSVKQTSDEEYIEVRVKDSGCGFDEETRAHIFDKFYQGDTSHAEEGNGLGLALVQKIAERNGYRIDVESEEGKGTEFTVKIKK